MNFQKKFKNIYTLFDLIGMNKDFDSNPEKIKKDQNKRVHALMKRAYEIPFYREKFEATGTTPDDYHCAEDLVKFPTINKAELRLYMQKNWEDHPKERDSWQMLSTSGSSGTPLRIVQTHKEHARSNANWIRELMVAGYKPLRGKMYSFQTSHKAATAGKNDSFIQKFGLMRRKVVTEDSIVGDGIADTIRDINEYKPDMLVLRRNCLVRIVMYAEQHNMYLWKPKFYVPVAEKVDDVTRELLTKHLGPGLIDAYGSTESGNCIIKYPGKDFYYVVNDVVVANVYDENNQLADNGRLILTNLYKKTFPIINYDIGDSAESFMKDGLRYFTNISGRLNDMVKHENGADSSAYHLMKIANGTVGVAQYRFTQESYHDMLIQLAADPFNKTKTKEEIEEHFTSSVKKLFGDEFNIRVEWLDILPPDETGKQRCFVCNIK